jgi:hypothetical protein
LATGFTNSIFSITRKRTTAWTKNNLIDNSEHYDLSLCFQTVSYQFKKILERLDQVIRNILNTIKTFKNWLYRNIITPNALIRIKSYIFAD